MMERKVVKQLGVRAPNCFTTCSTISITYYNKRNTHFDVQELLLQFWAERHETWQEYGEA